MAFLGTREKLLQTPSKQTVRTCPKAKPITGNSCSRILLLHMMEHGTHCFAADMLVNLYRGARKINITHFFFRDRHGRVYYNQVKKVGKNVIFSIRTEIATLRFFLFFGLSVSRSMAPYALFYVPLIYSPIFRVWYPRIQGQAAGQTTPFFSCSRRHTKQSMTVQLHYEY